MVEMVEKQGRFGRKNGKGFYDYPEKGKGQKSLWAGPCRRCSRSISTPIRSTSRS